MQEMLFANSYYIFLSIINHATFASIIKFSLTYIFIFLINIPSLKVVEMDFSFIGYTCFLLVIISVNLSKARKDRNRNYKSSDDRNKVQKNEIYNKSGTEDTSNHRQHKIRHRRVLPSTYRIPFNTRMMHGYHGQTYGYVPPQLCDDR